MRLAGLAAFVEMGEMASGASGSGISARVHDAGVESSGAAAKGIERKGGGDVGGVGEDVCFGERQAQQCEHTLRTVQERESLFGLQCKGSDAGELHSFRAGHFSSLEFGTAFADGDGS